MMKIGNTLIEVRNESVLNADTDVIVNAANRTLMGGGGVDGAIHKAAGTELLDYMLQNFPDGTDVGVAVITPAFNLPQKHIVHVPGPIWKGGSSGEKLALKFAYITSLEQAASVGANSIAFCSISTGIYGYPLDDAAVQAIEAVVMWVKAHPNQFKTIRFSMFKDEEYDAFSKALDETIWKMTADQE